jgi:hypothetical protein
MTNEQRRGALTTIRYALLAVAAVVSSVAWSQQAASGQQEQRTADVRVAPNPQPTNTDVNTARGTEQAPFVIKFAPSDKVSAETSQVKSTTERWGLSDRIAVIAIVVGFLQFLALVATMFVMMRTAKRQLRAYVVMDASQLGDGTMLTPPQPPRANVPGVVALMKNTGQTPAYAVVSWGDIAVMQPLNENRLIPPPLSGVSVSANTLGAGQTNSKAIWFSRALTQTELTDVANGTQAIYYYGRIEYRDAFKQKRYTNFRLKYQGQFPPLPGVVLLYCSEGNETN